MITAMTAPSVYGNECTEVKLNCRIAAVSHSVMLFNEDPNVTET
jgi:hypothetical protein